MTWTYWPSMSAWFNWRSGSSRPEGRLSLRNDFQRATVLNLELQMTWTYEPRNTETTYWYGKMFELYHPRWNGAFWHSLVQDRR